MTTSKHAAHARRARYTRPATSSPDRRGFTMTEVLIVVGLLTLLASLFLPVVSKVRSAANGAVCLSNLRQMGTAWTMETAENRGRLMPYVWQTPKSPDEAWNGYWPGALERREVRGEALLCPMADEALDAAANKGLGNAAHAWTGRFSSNGTAIRMNATTYRQGSYGYNRYLTAQGGFGKNGKGDNLTAVKANMATTPVFLDAAWVDVRPTNGGEGLPVQPPPNLTGEGLKPGSPEHWKFLLARHGRSVNVYFADGSARRVDLADTYTLTWTADWVGYKLDLPSR
jgi:prepilin-type N-terminal cleavage/methylation domain-containing protein/prepilin-type processing-associated H-X9-DG protein